MYLGLIGGGFMISEETHIIYIYLGFLRIYPDFISQTIKISMKIDAFGNRIISCGHKKG